MRHPDLFQLLYGYCRGCIALHPFDVEQRFADILLHGQVRPQVKTLEHHPHPLTNLRQLAVGHGFAVLFINPQPLAADMNLPAVRLFQPVHAAQQRRFTGT